MTTTRDRGLALLEDAEWLLTQTTDTAEAIAARFGIKPASLERLFLRHRRGDLIALLRERGRQTNNH